MLEYVYSMAFNNLIIVFWRAKLNIFNILELIMAVIALCY